MDDAETVIDAISNSTVIISSKSNYSEEISSSISNEIQLKEICESQVTLLEENDANSDIHKDLLNSKLISHRNNRTNKRLLKQEAILCKSRSDTGIKNQSQTKIKLINQPATFLLRNQDGNTKQNKLAKLKKYLEFKTLIIQGLRNKVIQSEDRNSLLVKKIAKQDEQIKSLLNEINDAQQKSQMLCIKKPEEANLNNHFSDENNVNSTLEIISYLKAALTRKSLEVQTLISEKEVLENSIHFAKNEYQKLLTESEAKLNEQQQLYENQVNSMQQVNEQITLQLKESDKNVWELLDVLKKSENNLLLSQAKFWEIAQQKDGVIDKLEKTVLEMQNKLENQSIKYEAFNQLWKPNMQLMKADVHLNDRSKTNEKKIRSEINLFLDVRKKVLADKFFSVTTVNPTKSKENLNKENIQVPDSVASLSRHVSELQLNFPQFSGATKVKNWEHFGISSIENLEMLKIESVESLIILQNLERNIYQRIYALKEGNAQELNNYRKRSLKEFITRVNNLFACLQKIYLLAESFFTIFLPDSVVAHMKQEK